MPDTEGPEKKERREFMREKIVKQPLSRRQIARRIAALAGLAVLFGAVSAVSFTAVRPLAERYLNSRNSQRSKASRYTARGAAVLSAVSRVHNHHRPLRRFRGSRGSQVEPHRLKHKKVHRRQKQHGAKAYGMLFFHQPHLQKRICAPTGGLSVLSIINASSLRRKPWRFLPVEMHRYSRRCIR